MTVPTTVPELPTYGTVAEDLRRIADLFDKVEAVELREQPYIRLNIQPGGTDDEAIERTDAAGLALFGCHGKPVLMSGGTYHYDVEGQIGAVVVHLYSRISEETVKTREAATILAAKEAELERLRAEVAELRAARPGLDYQRDTDDGSEPGPRPAPHFESGLAPGVAVAPIATHYETNAWKDDRPGGSGAECACGTTFDGFDTLAEAVAELKRHIAAGNATEPVSESPIRINSSVTWRHPAGVKLQGGKVVRITDEWIDVYDGIATEGVKREWITWVDGKSVEPVSEAR